MAVGLTQEQTLISYLVQHPNLAKMYADKLERGIFLEQVSIDIYNEIKLGLETNIDVSKYSLQRKFGAALDYYIKLAVSEKTAIAKVEPLLKAQAEYYSTVMIGNRCNQYVTLLHQGSHVSVDSFVAEIVNLTNVSADAEIFNTNDMNEYLMQQINAPKKRDKGIPTGYEGVDDLLNGGFKKKHLNVLLGNSGMGKTTVIENFLLQMTKNHKGIFFSLEMPREEVWEDYFGILAGTRFINVVENDEYISPDGMDNYIIHMNQIKENLYMVDNPDLSVQAIHRMVKLHKMKHKGLDFIVIDHFHIIKKPHKPTEQEQFAEISRALKIIAKEENISVIVLAQVNRGNSDRKVKNPLLNDVKGTSALVSDSDVILGLYRPSYDIKQRGDTPHPAVESVVELTAPKGRRLAGAKLYMNLNWSSGKLDGSLSEHAQVDYLKELQNADNKIGGSGGSGFKK